MIQSNQYSTSYHGVPQLTKQLSTKGRALKSILKAKKEGGSLDGNAEAELQSDLDAANAQIEILEEALDYISIDYTSLIKGTATTITIPEDVDVIADNAFSANTSLSTILLKSTTPPVLGTDAFDGTSITSNTGSILVPADAVDAYKADSGWAVYTTQISAIPE